MDRRNYKIWLSVEDERRCGVCRKKQGKLVAVGESEAPPAHVRCRCRLKWAEAKIVGTATNSGMRGADWWLKTYGKLPPNYISVEEAKEKGWRSVLGNLDSVAPGRVIGGRVFQNRNEPLPTADGRIWYEADINYSGGYRGQERILYSNDRLLFASYDHYRTFVELI